MNFCADAFRIIVLTCIIYQHTQSFWSFETSTKSNPPTEPQDSAPRLPTKHLMAKFHLHSPTCPHCGNGDETAEHLLLLCPKWAAERQRYFGDSIDITDVFQDYESPVEFLISSGHLSPHTGSARRAFVMTATHSPVFNNHLYSP